MVSDHGIKSFEEFSVEKMAISKFKATCLAVLERVRRSRKPVLVTKFGEPVAEVVPASVPPRSGPWIGALVHTGRIRGDLLAPACDEHDWEVMNS